MSQLENVVVLLNSSRTNYADKVIVNKVNNETIYSFQSNSPPKIIFLVSNIAILACIPLRIYGDKNTEEAILGFAVPGSWFLLMFFAG